MSCRYDKRKPLSLSKLLYKLPRVAWIETVYSRDAEPKIPKGIKKNSYFGDALSFTDGDDIALNTYGLTWRVWPDTEPTEGEMREAAWIREEREEPRKKPVRIL